MARPLSSVRRSICSSRRQNSAARNANASKNRTASSVNLPMSCKPTFVSTYDVLRAMMTAASSSSACVRVMVRVFIRIPPENILTKRYHGYIIA